MADTRYTDEAQYTETTVPVRPERTRTERVVTAGEPGVYRQRDAALKRISWGAVFAGAVIAVTIQMMLNLLGLAIGFGEIDPATEANPLGGMGTAAGIWLAITTIIAFIIGGYAAGRLAGMPKKQDGFWHGVVTWGAVTLFMLYLMTTSVSSLVNSATGIVGQGLDFIGSVAPAAAETIQQQIPQDLNIQEQIPRVSPQEAQQISDNVAATMSSAALWAFIAAVIGLVSAAVGGLMGTPHDMPASEAVRRE